MTGKELAEGLGISQGMVSRLLKRGMPSDTIQRAKRWRNRHMERPRLKGIRVDTRPVPMPKQPGTVDPPDPAPELFDDDDRDEGERAFDDFRTARDKREHFAALTAQMEYEKACGLLMDAGEVIAVITQMGTDLRQALEQWPTALAPQLVHLTTEDEVRAFLDFQVELVLTNISLAFKKLSRQAAGEGPSGVLSQDEF